VLQFLRDLVLKLATVKHGFNISFARTASLLKHSRYVPVYRLAATTGAGGIAALDHEILFRQHIWSNGIMNTILMERARALMIRWKMVLL
jgi:hypothetical protein